MDKFFKIECPVCKSILIIDRFTGKIIEKRKPLVKKPSGDRFQDAFKKYSVSKKETEEKFIKSQKEEKNKKKHLDKLFQKGVEKVKKSGKIEKEIRDIDLD